MNSINIKTIGLIRSINEKANGQRKWGKMEAKQFIISEELTPNRVGEKKTKTIESTQK